MSVDWLAIPGSQVASGSPEGKSVNDGINKDTCSLSYTSVDEVVECILMVGKGALLAKMDVMQAYRNVPVHPQDWFLLGMRWQDTVFVDNTLPFGLRSVPLIFSAIADMLQWIMHIKGVELDSQKTLKSV